MKQAFSIRSRRHFDKVFEILIEIRQIIETYLITDVRYTQVYVEKKLAGLSNP